MEPPLGTNGWEILGHLSVNVLQPGIYAESIQLCGNASMYQLDRGIICKKIKTKESKTKTKENKNLLSCRPSTPSHGAFTKFQKRD